MPSQDRRPTLAVIGEGLAELTFSDDGGVHLLHGGDAGNICVMAGRAGARTGMIGRVGADRLGDSLLGYWSSEGIDVTGVRVDPGGPTGLYLNEPTGDGHRFVYLRTGSAGSRLEPEDVDAELFDQVGLLVVTGITLAVSESSAAAAARAVALARAAGARVALVLNHRPALGGDVRRLADMAGASDVMIGSTEDALSVFGTENPLEFVTGPAEIVLTDGADPALLVEDGELWRQPVPDVPVRNAAGAGDALAGAYLAQRLALKPPREALRLGVAAAALSVQRDGCGASYPTGAAAATYASQLADVQLATRPRP